MNLREKERIAIVEQKVKNLSDDVTEVKADVKEILQTLNNLSGGKQALMWATGVTLTIAALVVAWLNFLKRS